jgi:peptide/nickel transport system substrate-binding protein
VGIEASVRTADFSAWQQRVQEGSFDLSIGWSYEGATPYVFYRWLLSAQTVKPLGTVSMSNWHRFGSAEGDRLLSAFEREPDQGGQRRIAAQLQRVFAAEAPAIPLYPNPSWGEFNTRRFRGFPTAQQPFADPSPNKFDRGETLLVLTALEPR